jgi:DNA primase
MKRRYGDFASRINIDAFEEAIDFEVIDTDKNNNDVGHCPDPWGLHKHGDQTGKFAIQRDKKVYNCWVCGGGSLLSLVMAIKDIDEAGAIDWLYQFASEDAISEEQFEDEIARLMATEIDRKKPLPYFNEHVLDRYESAYDWGAERGISEEVIDGFQVKFDPVHLRRGKTKDDYIGPGIILPHFWQGRLVGWQVRWLDEERPKFVSKYTNTGDFPKDSTVYNYDRSYFAEEIVVCESVPTVMVLATHGIPAMATFGSNVNDDQMKYLRGCAKGLVIAPDNDGAGAKYVDALYEGLDRFIPLKMVEPVGEPDSGSDLGDLFDDPEALIERVKNAEYL